MLEPKYWDIFRLIVDQQILRPRADVEFPDWLIVERDMEVLASRNLEELNDFRDNIVGYGISPMLKDREHFYQVWGWLDPLISRTVWLMIRQLVQPVDRINPLQANVVADDLIADIDTFVQTRAGRGIEPNSPVERLLWVAQAGGIVTGLTGDMHSPTVTAYFPDEQYPKVDLEPLYRQLESESGFYLPGIVGDR